MMRVVVAGLIALIVAAAAGYWLVPPATTQRVLAQLGIAQAGAGAPAKATAEPPAPLAPAVTVVTAQEKSFIDRLFVSGTLVARDEAMVGAAIDGLRIVELLAEDGDRVAKGQVLARLDRSQLDALIGQNDAALARADAAIAQARNQIDQTAAMREQAAADLARAKKLDPGILTQSTLDQRLASARSSEAQHEAAKSALAVAEAEKRSREAERRELMVRIDRTEVKAPVAGLISRRHARLGALAMASGEALFRIIADGAIDLEADVPEDSLARLRLRMAAAITLPGSDGQVTGRVRLIASEVDKATRLGKVRIALPAEANARIGSFAAGVVEIERRSAVSVPASAVTQTAGGDTVEVVRDNRVALRKVVTGITNDAAVELRSGLSPGETVIARAAAFLRDGDAVRVVAGEMSAREAKR
jgi:HlyD family secretion protein